MFGIGFWEIAVILIIALVVFGPEDLIKHTKKVAVFFRTLNKYKHEVWSEFRSISDELEAPNFDKVDSQEPSEAKELKQPVPESPTPQSVD